MSKTTTSPSPVQEEAGEETVDDLRIETELPQVLVVADFSANLGKIERHLGPLRQHADVNMVCITGDESIDDIRYRTVPDFGWRPIGLLLMGLVAMLEARERDYDGVVSFSLVPHGCIALAISRMFGIPVHLGIIGADLDVHVQAWYGTIAASLIRRFDVVSSPGLTHQIQLVELGVSPNRTAILANAVDVAEYQPVEHSPETYDLLWVGRFSPEKDPARFVETCAQLDARGIDVSAVMVGDGPLFDHIERSIQMADLSETIELTGWVDDPVDYYQKSRLFVLTSERDALPLTLIEAMATGCVPVVPIVGNIQDAARDGENAIVVDDRSPSTYAGAIAAMLTDPDRIDQLSEAAVNIREQYSYQSAAVDWQAILDGLGLTTSPATTIAADRNGG